MGSNRKLWMALAAALLSAGLVYGLYHLQRQQLTAEETIGVVIPKRFIAAGEVIKGEDLEIARLARDAFAVDMLLDIYGAVGLEAAVPLGKGEPLLVWKLNEYGLQPGLEESTFGIPKEYIKSISSGIRAGDLVQLYASGGTGESRKLFPDSVVVASVKTSGNVEIDNLAQSHLLALAEGNKEGMYAARRDANGTIDFLNLNLTEEQWLELDNLCRDGEIKLVVAYSPESFQRLEGTGSREGITP
ncbi:SAF domain-containing protein [Paenibacillus sp. CAU 1782]